MRTVFRFAWAAPILLLGACTVVSAPEAFGGGAGDAAVEPDTSVLPPPDAGMPTGCDRPGETLGGKKAMGASCTANAECASGVCTQLNAFRLSTTGGTGQICTRTCADDCDCPDEFICWNSGSGVRACLKPSERGIAVGDQERNYTQGPAQCTSGVGAFEYCARTCADDDACDMDQRCGGFPEYKRSNYDISQIACIPKNDLGFNDPSLAGARNLARGEDCTNSDQCQSRLCLEGKCRVPCRSTATCGVASGEVCRTVRGFGDEEQSPDMLQACMPKYGGYTKEEAATATTMDQCANDNRIGDARTDMAGDVWCSPVCATDADCATYAGSLRCIAYRRPGTSDTTNPFLQKWSTACGK